MSIRPASSWLVRLRDRGALRRAAVLATEPRAKTVFVLLGGGSRGAAQAGVITTLLRNGIVPDAIIGVSIGSWNGAYLAADPTPDGARELERLWLSTATRDILGARRWRAAAKALVYRTSLYGSEGMQRLAFRHFADKSFADLKVPLAILTANLTDGSACMVESGPLLPAIIASSSMPGIFPPVVEDDAVYVDGGIVEWTACTAALEAGATTICLLGCGQSLAPGFKAQGLRRILERSWELGIRNDFERTVFATRRTGVRVLAIQPEIGAGSILDFDRAPQFIAAGREAAERALRTWGDADERVPALAAQTGTRGLGQAFAAELARVAHGWGAELHGRTSGLHAEARHG